MPPPKAVILDRDGTLIDVVRHHETGVITVAFHPCHLRLLPGVLEGLELLVSAGYVLGVATNQPGPAKGQFPVSAVEATNQALSGLLEARGIPIAAFEVCLHHPDGGPGGDPALRQHCSCRKPKPGLLQRVLRNTGVAPDRAWMIGDSPSDVEAAHAAGVRVALLFPRDRCELCPLRDGPSVRPDLSGARLDQLARAIIDHDASACSGSSG